MWKTSHSENKVFLSSSKENSWHNKKPRGGSFDFPLIVLILICQIAISPQTANYFFEGLPHLLTTESIDEGIDD